MARKVSELKAVFKSKGIMGIKDAISEDLLAWKSVKINLAVTGESGTGKSSFINSLRGLNGEDKRAARVGPTETTTKPRQYSHPNNSNFLLWDLPGVGTPNYPKKNYLERINFDSYDFFIITVGTRITETDNWLAKEIANREKRCYLIRTKFGNDVRNAGKASKDKQPLNETEVAKMKQDVLNYVTNNVSDMKCKDNVFIIDSHQRKSFDFPELENRLKHDTFKREAMILTLQALTEEAINEKKMLLEDRIWRTALQAAFAPRLKSVDVSILMEEKEFYKVQFNMDEDSLKQDASGTNVTEEELCKLLEAAQLEDDTKQDQSYIDEIANLVPFLPIANQVKTYKFSKRFLKGALNSTVQCAIEVNKKFAANVAKEHKSYT